MIPFAGFKNAVFVPIPGKNSDLNGLKVSRAKAINVKSSGAPHPYIANTMNLLVSENVLKKCFFLRQMI